MLQAVHCLLGREYSLATSRRLELSLDNRVVQTTFIKLISIALLLGIAMPKEQSPEARLNAIFQEQQRLVHQLKDATPARKYQIQAEIVSLSEEQAELLQEAGAVNCFIFTSSSKGGTGWIEEERNFDGSVRQYRYGYYHEGKSRRRYLPKRLVPEVQRMISARATPMAILEFLDRAKKQQAVSSARK